MANSQHHTKRASVISLTIFFLILLSTGLSGHYIWQGFLHGFDKYLPILCSTLLLDGLGIFALVFKVSFETRRRAVVPFIASLSLIIVCSIHLAALANMRTGAISQDESDTRTKRLDDERHVRNVRDANALVEMNCSQCSPERKRRMYQSEMTRLEKSQAQAPSTDQSGQSISDQRSWGRRYIEDYATAVQLIFGLLCGLAMLTNNFLRLYAKDPLLEGEGSRAQPADDDFPQELDVIEKQPRHGRPELVAKTTTHDDRIDDTRSDRKTTRAKNPPGLRELREALKLIAFNHPPGHFKADIRDDYVIIRSMVSDRGDQHTAHSTKAALSILDDAATMDAAAFKKRLEDFLRKRDFNV